MATYYINGKYRGGSTETIDEFPRYTEAREALREYRMGFGPDYRVWLSQRSTKEWRENR